MTRYRFAPRAIAQVDEISDFTARRWDEAQAAAYVEGLFAEIDRIARRDVPWRRLPATSGLVGFRRAWRSHVIYWRAAGPDMEIVAILHNRMDQLPRARAAFTVGD